MNRYCITALLWGMAFAGSARTDDSAGHEFFEKKVRPALAAHCYKCHSAKTKQRGGLQLDSRKAILIGGDTGPAIVPGNPKKSLMIQAIGYTEDLRMPPKSKAPDEVIADLTKWVEMGAPWPDDSTTIVGKLEEFDLEKRLQHWSFQPMKLIPPSPTTNTTWARSPLDQYILAGLEQAGLGPAPPTDKRTWLRRVTFDVTGLPATREEIDAFLADNSELAYERVVDRLLASPRYGERWGRHWLDLVRFAETQGHEFDFEMPEAYMYRDYIVRAFNEDVPYNQLVREHIAGDLLEQPRRNPVDGLNESVLGTGFWFLGEGKHSPVDLRGDGADRRDNQIDVFGKAFLGLTIACARCHDHKFDPIPTADYYGLVSVLQSSRLDRAFLDPPSRIHDLAEQHRAITQKTHAMAIAQSVGTLVPRVNRFPSLVENGVKQDDPLFRFAPELFDEGTSSPDKFKAAKARVIARLAQQRQRYEAEQNTHILFENFDKPGYEGWYPTGDAFGDGPTQATDVVLNPDANIPVADIVEPRLAHSGRVSGKLQGALRSRTFTIGKKRILYHVGGKGATINLIIDGFQIIRNPIYGGLRFKPNSGDKLVWHSQDVSMWQGLQAYIEVLDDGNGYAVLDQVLFTDGGPPRESPPNEALNETLAQSETREEWLRNYGVFLSQTLQLWNTGKANERADLLRAMVKSPTLLDTKTTGPLPKATRKLRKALQEASKVEKRIVPPRRGMAITDGNGIHDHIYIRGNPKNLGEEAERNFLVAVAGEDQGEPEVGSGRFQIAEEMVDPTNPLVARVMVNRLWHHHFGRGIVATPDSFGLQGAKPTHPELLDYLALELIRRDWSLKEMHKLILLSSTYRMSSQADDPKAAQVDADNKLLHRMPIRRLEAEAIRDTMLFVSGRLDTKMFGRGPFPHLTPFMIGRGRPRSGPLDGAGRRSIYLNVRRNFLEPMFLAFDYPTPFSCIGKRTVSNVPAQALILLNNPFVVQQAKLWANDTLAKPGLSDEERLVELYIDAFGRRPTNEEAQDAKTFLAEQGQLHGQAGSPRAWEDLCHVLFNVKEFIFVN